MERSEIEAIPLEGDVSFRQRAVEPERAALLVVDLQKGEYNAKKRHGTPTASTSTTGFATSSSRTGNA